MEHYFHVVFKTPVRTHTCVSKIYNNDTGTLISICSCIEYQRLNEYVAKIAAFLHDVAISDTQGYHCFADVKSDSKRKAQNYI